MSVRDRMCYRVRELILIALMIFLLRIGSSAAQSISEFPLHEHTAPLGISTSMDGALWFTEQGAGGGRFYKIGRITTHGAITEFDVPGLPSYITVGPGGSMWFVESFQTFGKDSYSGSHWGTIARLVVEQGFVGIKEFSIPRTGSDPGGIAFGPDGALWFARGNKIGRITSDGVETEITIPTMQSSIENDLLGATRIAAGPDGAMWFNEIANGKIGRVTLTGEIREYSLPGINPANIARGPNQTIWFTDYFNSKIGWITTAGNTTVLSLSPDARPHGIALGPDGAMWFAEGGKHMIGRVSFPGSAIVEYPVPSGSDPAEICAGPDGAMWFTMPGAAKIGRIDTVMGKEK